MSGIKATNDKRGGGLGRVRGQYIDAGMSWDDLAWLKKVWKGKVVLEGVQGHVDALRAVKEGMDGIVLRNHGGRSLDTSSPAILILPGVAEVFSRGI